MPIRITAHYEKVDMMGDETDLRMLQLQIPVDRYSHTDVGNWFVENNFGDLSTEESGLRSFDVQVLLPAANLPLARGETNTSFMEVHAGENTKMLNLTEGSNEDEDNKIL